MTLLILLPHFGQIIHAQEAPNTTPEFNIACGYYQQAEGLFRAGCFDVAVTEEYRTGCITT